MKTLNVISHITRNKRRRFIVIIRNRRTPTHDCIFSMDEWWTGGIFTMAIIRA